MQPIQTPITGDESIGTLSLPYQALAQFYYAFNHRDLEAMADNWADTGEIVMDNPLGGVKRGWNEIRTVYENIFNGPPVQVEFYDYTIHEAGELFYAVGRERGTLGSGESAIQLHIRTTRVFRMLNGRWRQVHHHGSIEDPRLLERYQTAILAGTE